MATNRILREREPSKLLSRRQVGDLALLSERTVDRLVARGLLPRPFKLGAQTRWSRAAIEKWLAEGCPAVDVTSQEAAHVR